MKNWVVRFCQSYQIFIGIVKNDPKSMNFGQNSQKFQKSKLLNKTAKKVKIQKSLNSKKSKIQKSFTTK